MRKYITILLVILVLVGCSKKPAKTDILLEKYEAAYGDLINNDKFEESSTFYDVEVVINKVADGNFRIDTIVDNPKVAMYKVQIIADINSNGVEQYEQVVPSVGIVDQATYNLIPFQVNHDEGFYAGLVVSGISKQDKGDVIVEVTWTDYAETKSYQEFLKLTYDINPVEEVEEEQEADDE